MSPRPPTELAGLSIRVDGVPAPVFMAFDNFFAFEVPRIPSGAKRIRSADLYFNGGLAAKMVTSPIEAYPGRYMAEFAVTSK
jgi:hypothetical protein